MASYNSVRDPHDITPPPQGDPKTPEDLADDEIEGAEIAQDPDRFHREAYGDESEDTIGDEINKDEIAIVKDLPISSQKSKNKK